MPAAAASGAPATPPISRWPRSVRGWFRARLAGTPTSPPPGCSARERCIRSRPWSPGRRPGPPPTRQLAPSLELVVRTRTQRASLSRSHRPGRHARALHSAKGLEWGAVFLVGRRDTTIRSSTHHREPLAEERRLLYVGITGPLAPWPCPGHSPAACQPARGRRPIRFLNGLRQRRRRLRSAAEEKSAVPRGRGISELCLSGRLRVGRKRQADAQSVPALRGVLRTRKKKNTGRDRDARPGGKSGGLRKEKQGKERIRKGWGSRTSWPWCPGAGPAKLAYAARASPARVAYPNLGAVEIRPQVP